MTERVLVIFCFDWGYHVLMNYHRKLFNKQLQCAPLILAALLNTSKESCENIVFIV